METCECGQPGTEVCFQTGSSDEVWFCGSRKHRTEIQQMAAQGWHTQSATVAASATGRAIRQHMQHA
jgi:hypothetical protein